MDSDGDLDLAVGNDSNKSNMFENTRQGETGSPNTAPYFMVTRPGSTADANFYSSPDILSEEEIPIPYTLFDPEGDPVKRIELFYSLDGGGNPGPNKLPLSVTEVSFVEPETLANPLLDPFFHITDEDGTPLVLPLDGLLAG